jgi:hypothetical protein
LFTIVFLFVLFALGLLVARHYYAPATVAAYNAAPENLSKDLEWRATAQSRRAVLAQVKTEQTAKLEGYSWVDQKSGLVRLPIERAMELTAAQYGAKK